VIKQERQRSQNSKKKTNKLKKIEKGSDKMTSDIKWDGAQISEIPHKGFHSAR
jgi:hypothetical protein